MNNIIEKIEIEYEIDNDRSVSFIAYDKEKEERTQFLNAFKPVVCCR